MDEKLIKVVPSERQMQYLQNGYNCFIHYTMNTYTDLEWGTGDEKASQFSPASVDTDEWAETAKCAGMNGIILTCKHHDGFCLWPSKYTEHSIKHSPYKNGKGDIVKELSDSCRKYGLKFGVYLSPWDRNSKYYGNGRVYDDYYVNQLTELLTEYGDIFAVWLDGACGENAEGKKQVYDWERYFETIRKLQPSAVISICGPDIRWCGNEAGIARPNEWSVVSNLLCTPELTAELSQKEDDSSFRDRPIDPTLEELGSREVLKHEKKLIYYPSEMDVSIRPGWFYHTYEDDKVRSLDDLFDIYLKSVGHNSTLLLNVPPMPNGHFHEIDKRTLKALGDRIKSTFKDNLIPSADIIIKNGEKIGNTNIKGYGPSVDITLQWDNEIELSYLVIQEDIRFSQRVEKYEVYATTNDSKAMELVANGTTIGYNKIIPLGKIKSNQIMIRIVDSRILPILKEIMVY